MLRRGPYLSKRGPHERVRRRGDPDPGRPARTPAGGRPAVLARTTPGGSRWSSSSTAAIPPRRRAGGRGGRARQHGTGVRHRVRVLANASVAGLPGARNTGIAAVDTDLVAFCDDDDQWLPGKLARAGGGDGASPAPSSPAAASRSSTARAGCQAGGHRHGHGGHLVRSRMVMVHSSTFVFRRGRALGGRERPRRPERGLGSGPARRRPSSDRARRPAPGTCALGRVRTTSPAGPTGSPGWSGCSPGTLNWPWIRAARRGSTASSPSTTPRSASRREAGRWALRASPPAWRTPRPSPSPSPRPRLRSGHARPLHTEGTASERLPPHAATAGVATTDDSPGRLPWASARWVCRRGGRRESVGVRCGVRSVAV